MNRRALLFAPVLAVLPGCRPGTRRAPSVSFDVGPSVRVSPTLTRAGRPVATTYRWSTGAGFAAFERPYCAFVHFVSQDGVVLLQDDHVPDPPPRQWERGHSYEYTRTVFTHHQFPGPLEIRVGLYDPADGARAALRGVESGRNVYSVGHVDVARHAPLEQTLFFSGFKAPWSDNTQPFDVVRSMDRTGVVACRNPREDAVFFLRAQAPKAAPAPPVLGISVGSVQREHVLEGEDFFALAVRIDRASLGDQEFADVTLTMSEPSGGQAPATLRVAHAILCAAADIDEALLRAFLVL
jgi:hypothetical protein